MDGPVFSLHSPEFAADPHGMYAKMRPHGTEDFALVELAPAVRATLVIGWARAVEILHDSNRFGADPSRWQARMDPRCSVLPMMGARDNALRSDGAAHEMYRGATNAALAGVDLHQLHRIVAEHGTDLVREAVDRGNRMDLVADYAWPLAFRTINTLMGCPDQIGEALADGFAMMFEAVPEPDKVDELIDSALRALVALKRRDPGRDIPTRLIQHAGQMSDSALRAQILTMYAAAIEPLLHLIVNTVLLLMTDPRFRGELVSGAYTTEDALHEVLFRDSPLANLCVRYPIRPVLFESAGIILPADEPVVIGMAACNTDPRILRDPDASGYVDFSRNASHLSFSAGDHDCPARTLAFQIVADGINELLDHLPDIRLACRPEELEWRPGPFQRALKALPVVFDPPRAPRPSSHEPSAHAASATSRCAPTDRPLAPWRPE